MIDVVIRVIVRSLLFLLSSITLVVILVYTYPYAHLDVLENNWPNKSLDVHMPAKAQFVRASLSNHITLNALEGGAQNDKLLVLLHGFPETALITWGHLIDRFIDQGYHVIAPDMRGYNQSSKPVSSSMYTMDHIATDIQLLITEYAGKEKATVMGVDWGGVIAWHFSQRYPQHLDMFVNSITFYNLKHVPVVLQLKQLWKSWYIFFLQLRGIAESAVSKNDFALLFHIAHFDELGRKGLFSRKLANRFISALSPTSSTPTKNAVHNGDPPVRATSDSSEGSEMDGGDALVSPIQYYRNFVYQQLFAPKPQHNVPLSVPTLIICPERDRYIDARLAKLSFEQMVAPSVSNQSQLVVIDSSHWITLENPNLLFDTFLSFLHKQKGTHSTVSG